MARNRLRSRTTSMVSAPAARADGSPPAWLRILPPLVAIATFLAFLRAVNNEFVNWDDKVLLLRNDAYRGLGLDHLKWMFTTFHTGPYQPLTWITYAVDYLTWGTSPFGFHLTSIVLHALAAAAFCFVARRLLAWAVPDANPIGLCLGSAVAAVFFAIHPLRTESVAWVTERRDIVSGLFLLLTLSAYFAFVDATTVRARRRWYAAALALYLLSLLGKATGITLPIILLILDGYPLRRLAQNGGAISRLVLEKVPFALLAAAFAALAIHGQATESDLSTLSDVGLLERVLIAGHAAAFYVWKTLLPIGLHARYESASPINAYEPRFIVGTALAFVATLVAVTLRHRWPALLAAWMCYLVALAPVSGLAQAGSQIAADRYTYVPCMPFAVLTGSAWVLLGRRRTIGADKPPAALSAVTIAILFIFAGLTFRQIAFWKDSFQLWFRCIAIDPNCSYAHCNLATMYAAQGDIPRALHHGEIGTRLRPNDAEAHSNYAVFLEQAGRTDEALAIHRRAANMSNTTPLAVTELGSALFRAGRLADAEPVLERALALKPNDAKALIALGLIRIHQSRPDDARVLLRDALRDPAVPSEAYLNVATAWFEAGRAADAIASLRAGLARFPDDAGLLNRLSWILATIPDDSLRRPAEAADLARRAVAITNQRDPYAWLSLAAALAESGYRQDSEAALAAARSLVEQLRRADILAAIDRIADDVRAGRPIRHTP
ncbi:MAG: tetratricopeptide repeat protein [Phycisphaerae bacterium]|nr:tetratricopeptide repeat protein [Phycisphaerae bacterium]